MNNYENNIEILNQNIKKMDETINLLSSKSTEVKAKIDMLVNKVNLKLENSTQLLQFQQSIINNEITYFKNLKNILISNVHNQLYDLSENITFLTMSVVNIYKDIPNSDNKLTPMSQKSDSLTKILSDISHNLEYINEMLNKFKTYNEQLTVDMSKGNFHCKTLQKDMENIYNHIDTEYNKFVHNANQRMEYYIEFSNNICSQVESTKIAPFYS
jgi:chromosome segregation ATPase